MAASTHVEIKFSVIPSWISHAWKLDVTCADSRHFSPYPNLGALFSWSNELISTSRRLPRFNRCKRRWGSAWAWSLRSRLFTFPGIVLDKYWKWGFFRCQMKFWIRAQVGSIGAMFFSRFPLSKALAYQNWNTCRKKHIHRKNENSLLTNYFFFPFLNRRQGISLDNRSLQRHESQVPRLAWVGRGSIIMHFSGQRPRSVIDRSCKR